MGSKEEPWQPWGWGAPRRTRHMARLVAPARSPSSSPSLPSSQAPVRFRQPPPDDEESGIQTAALLRKPHSPSGRKGRARTLSARERLLIWLLGEGIYEHMGQLERSVVFVLFCALATGLSFTAANICFHPRGTCAVEQAQRHAFEEEAARLRLEIQGLLGAVPGAVLENAEDLAATLAVADSAADERIEAASLVAGQPAGLKSLDAVAKHTPADNRGKDSQVPGIHAPSGMTEPTDVGELGPPSPSSLKVGPTSSSLPPRLRHGGGSRDHARNARGATADIP